MISNKSFIPYVLSFLFCGACMVTQSASAQGELLEFVEGESKTVTENFQLANIAVGDPNVADVRIMGRKNEFLVVARRAGLTNLTLWGAQGEKKEYMIQINKAILPKPLIQINARLLEVKLRALKKLGVDWMDAIDFGGSPLGGGMNIGKLTRTTPISAKLKFLLESGEAKILAKPNLVALSEGNAVFQVGGQIPIPTPQQDGSITVTWKDYGVILKVSPIGDRRGNKIQTKIYAEVSVIDFGSGVSFQGISIPGITKRSVETEVQVTNGETIVLAGLVKKEETSSNKKIPVLGNLPVLGYFFGSRDSENNDTEVTIFLTPSFTGE